MNVRRIAPQKTLAEIAAKEIRDAILTGAFKLGENISEDRLVAQMGISRTPIRDAMAILSREGLVNVRPKRGSFVFETSLEDLAAICDYRQMLEAQGARAAMRTDRTGFLETLSAVVEKMAAALANGEIVEYGQLDSAFHQAAFDHCGNSYLRDSYALVAGRIATLRANITAPYEARREESMNEHRSMLDMLAREDFAAFDAALAAHVQRTADVYQKALADGHLGPDRKASEKVAR
ncbi:GntR family transcriptional regulator [Oricola indica]|jgi:DNA-binding GntR family transcriptional regulator|uniref:GntR family transcriptional regulator n=1 Tax=Oricola indica TaxID=2872591 RepID=UPI001CBB4852|nr:GntR family transcriptional regulator [Oricola indica]